MTSADSRRTYPLPSNWGVIRAEILKRDMYCQWGSQRSDGVPELWACGRRSEEVDHISDPRNHDPHFLRGLCSMHHAIKTGRQGAEARHKITPLRKRPPDKHPGFKN